MGGAPVDVKAKIGSESAVCICWSRLVFGDGHSQRRPRKRETSQSCFCVAGTTDTIPATFGESLLNFELFLFI